MQIPSWCIAPIYTPHWVQTWFLGHCCLCLIYYICSKVICNSLWIWGIMYWGYLAWGKTWHRAIWTCINWLDFYPLFSVLFKDLVRYLGPIAVMLDDQNMNIQHWLNENDRESEVLQENHVPLPVWALQIPCGLSWCSTHLPQCEAGSRSLNCVMAFLLFGMTCVQFMKYCAWMFKVPSSIS